MIHQGHNLGRAARRLATRGVVGRLTLVFWATSLLMTGSMGCAPEKPSKAKLEGTAQSIKGSANGAERVQDRATIEAAPVAEVNGEAISLGEFNRRVRELPEFARVRYASVSQQQEWLDSVAQFEVMADVAEEKGMGERPEVYFALKQAMADQILDEVVREKLAMDDIDEAAIDAYYQAYQAEFSRPKARRVVLIEATTREEAARVRERVLQEMDRAEDSAINAFRRAAAAYSTDRAVGMKGGDIGFIPADAPSNAGEDIDASRRARIAEAVAALEQPAQVSPVFALDPGWALATFIEERPASQTSKEDAAAEIRQRLYQERRDKIVAEFIATLRADAQIRTFPDEVARIEAAPRPPARDVSEITLRKKAAFGVKKP